MIPEGMNENQQKIYKICMKLKEFGISDVAKITDISYNSVQHVFGSFLRYGYIRRLTTQKTFTGSRVIYSYIHKPSKS